ncbi:Transcriptional regulator, LysR family [hydrothermal vent metagenome]|uniref:Transcriptional regulator, LysR family n=1 Tax=hydrothermal vent metagenome TaxID=652676 RepID=A0A3B0ZJH5_9ZZZZ
MNDWDDIRYFLEVARSGNVTSAAKILGVNHSTVSRRIRALEEKHGVRLFERIPTGYEMTKAASTIYETALEVEAKNQLISRQLFGQDSRLQGEITLTMPHDILDYCVIDDLAEFRHSHPDIQLNILVSPGLINMAAREADIAIRLTPNPPNYLIGNEISKLQHGVYINTQVSHLNTTPIVVWNDEKQVPDWAKNNFTNAEIALRVDDLYSMYAAVKAGIGVASMPCYMPDVVFNLQSQVRRLPIDLPISHWGLWVLSHVDLRHTARVRYCREFLIKRLKQNRALYLGQKSQYIEQ